MSSLFRRLHNTQQRRLISSPSSAHQRFVQQRSVASYLHSCWVCTRSIIPFKKIFMKYISPKDLAVFIIGCYIGTQLKAFCWVEGRSMYPTLHPGELMLRIHIADPHNSWTLQLLKKWRSLGFGGKKAQPEEGKLVPEEDGSSTSLAESLIGRIVVLQVKQDGTLICKRVTHPTEKDLMEQSSVNDTSDWDGTRYIDDDEGIVVVDEPEEEVRKCSGDETESVDVRPSASLAPMELPSEPLSACPIIPGGEEAAAKHAAKIFGGNDEHIADKVGSDVGGDDNNVGQDEAEDPFKDNYAAFEARLMAEVDTAKQQKQQQDTTQENETTNLLHPAVLHRNHYMKTGDWRWCFDQDESSESYADRVAESGGATPATTSSSATRAARHQQVPQEYIWMAGDNPPESLDSRAVGHFPLDCMRGIPIAVVWPLQNARLLL